MATPIPALSWASYLRWMLASLVAGVACVGAFNILVDPLAVFGSPRITGINAVKPYLDHHRELARWQSARRACANAGIFGNSRAEIGFDPENPVFGRHGLSAFNHAIPGSHTRTSLRQMDWLAAVGCMPRVIVLGVDFFDFLGGNRPRPADLAKADPAPEVDARFLAESVFSLSGLSDSVGTLALQHVRNPAMLTERGFNPLRNYIGEVEQSGHYVLFRQRAEENLRRWQSRAPRLRPPDGGASQDEQLVDAILDRTVAAGSTVHLIIYPYHAEIRLMIERLGIGGLFAEWKRSLLALAERPRKGAGQVVVWDFSGIGSETREAIPARGDRKTQLKYYWEAGHFKKELGDRIIVRIFGDEDTPGVRLRSDNIGAWLAEDQRRVAELQSQDPGLSAEVDDLLAKASAR